MKCAWSAVINILPMWMRQTVDKAGRDTLLELRLRINLPAELVLIGGSRYLDRAVSQNDLSYCINAASQYSPWSATSLSYGYITIDGGHRVGVCGQMSRSSDRIVFNAVTSICIRVARDFFGISKDLCDLNTSTLIIGKPGSGKTTLLRDLIIQKSDQKGQAVCVIDERGELFPSNAGKPCFRTGKRTDILTGRDKRSGIEMAIRNMCPDIIAVDEITAAEDCDAMMYSGWCGVKLIATAHAGSCEDLYNRPVYEPILRSKLFDTLVIMRSDRSWTIERMC